MAGFLQTLMRPDQEEDPERALVARASNILQIGEFQLIQLAYLKWHGKDLPPWARHYAREILALDERGEVDANDPAYHRYDHNYVTHVPKGVQHFTIASMVLAFMLVGGILIGHMAGSEATSILPPFFEPEQLQQNR